MKFRNSLFLAPLFSSALAFLALSATGHAQSVSNIGDKIAKTNAKNGAAPQQSPFEGTVVEDIIARVNDQIISRSDFDRAEAELQQQAKQRSWSEAEVDSQRKELLRDLIDNQLLLSKGKELTITGETETVRQLDELRKQNHLESMEDLQKAAEQQGVSFEDFKASIRNRVITSQVIRDEVGRRINITQGEEQGYYDQHKSDFDRAEAVRLSEILIPTPNADDAAEVSAAEAKAADIETQLKAGKDFATLAKASSGNPTAAQGGTLGEYKRGQLAKVLEDATFSLQPGQFTPPLRTKQGYVVLKVDAHQAGGIAPFKDVEGEIQDQLGMEKMNPALRQYLQRLREEAYIDIKPGYVDAGASPNQTKPIFSAYTPPQPKKKKKLERTRFGGRGRTITHAPASQSARATAPGVPAGVPSLADVPHGGTDQATASAGTAAGDTATGASAAASSQASAGGESAAAAPATAATPATAPGAAARARVDRALQAASAGTMKPGKKEKIRFGQAPRETLPGGMTQNEDAGATAANGNGSSTEQQIAAETTPPNPGATQSGTAPAGARYNNGESAGEESAPAPDEKKTRFSSRPTVKKAKKSKSKVDPFAPAPAPTDEVATKQVQDAPLGLSGDTSKKLAKPKPTGPKTRFSNDTRSKAERGEEAPADAAAPGGLNPATQTPASVGPTVPAGPATQTAPNGNGDPLGPTNATPPNPAPPAAQPQF